MRLSSPTRHVGVVERHRECTNDKRSGEKLRSPCGARSRSRRPCRRVLRASRTERSRQVDDASHDGRLRPDHGAVSIFGIDALATPIEAKRITAWLPDEPMLYERLTPVEYLEFVAGLWQVEPKIARREAEALIGMLGLATHASERCGGFSKGMRQKVALAGALVHQPRLIILDEPLTGLDAGAARQVKNVLLARVAAGCTVLMTTHILEVAERMAERIGIIADGRLIAEGTLAELRQRSGPGDDGLHGRDASLEDVFLGLVETRKAA